MTAVLSHKIRRPREASIIASRARIFTVAPRLDHHHSQGSNVLGMALQLPPRDTQRAGRPCSVARRLRDGRATTFSPRRQQARLVSPLNQCCQSTPLPIRRSGACAPSRSSSAETFACPARWAIKASRTSPSAQSPCPVCSCTLPSFSSAFVSCVFSQGKAFRLHHPGTNPPQPPSRAALHPLHRPSLT